MNTITETARAKQKNTNKPLGIHEIGDGRFVNLGEVLGLTCDALDALLVGDTGTAVSHLEDILLELGC